MLTTTSFESLARMQMRALGDDELALIVVDHPIGGITSAALEVHCTQASEQMLRWLQGEFDRRKGR